MATLAETVTLRDLENDPYPLYKELRQQPAPVTFVPAVGAWLVSRWDECVEAGADPSRFAKLSFGPDIARTTGTYAVNNMDGAKQADLRRGVDPAVEPRRVLASVDDVVQPIAKAYVDRIKNNGTADITAEYFEPVSVEALRHVMGLDGLVDTATFTRWFSDMSMGGTNWADDPEVWEKSDRATREIDEVVGAELERLRSSGVPNDGMLWHMLFAGRQGSNPRTNDEVIPTLKVIIIGGAQEPGHSAATATLGLLQNPDQMADVLDDLDLIPAVVHESLRWISPLAVTERRAIGEQVLGGVTIPAGDRVAISLASANHDESKFENPELFDIHRKRHPNQAFGHGEHLCAGHFFARHIERIMLEEVLPELPNLRLDPDNEPWIRGYAFRAPKRLPVLWDAPGAV
ncbi:MAG TPA: cytochrome P450 [Pseudolysinimonas sp.]|nr:cytochrome P450 [Pseudolysinimonas sp.]